MNNKITDRDEKNTQQDPQYHRFDFYLKPAPSVEIYPKCVCRNDEPYSEQKRVDERIGVEIALEIGQCHIDGGKERPSSYLN